MRLVRLGSQRAQVTSDITATLTSLRRASTALDGVALLGVQPPEAPEPLDAVVLLPGGVVTVVGVDLPDPAMRLEAPLRAQWKADGWPLVHAENAVNPATEALAVSESVLNRLRSVQPELAVGSIVALGPFVETIEQPPAELTGEVRILHPRPTSMLAALVSLACGRVPLTLEQARNLLARLVPDVPGEVEAALVAEGFAPSTEGQDPSTATTATIPVIHPGPSPWPEHARAAGHPGYGGAVPAPLAIPHDAGTLASAQSVRPEPRLSSPNDRRVLRWVTLALVLLLVLIVGTIALATSGTATPETTTMDKPHCSRASSERTPIAEAPLSLGAPI